MTATSMTNRSARRWWECSRASASRWTSTPSRNRNSSPRSRRRRLRFVFYLLGWTPTTLESFNVFQYIMVAGRQDQLGGNNVGDYCNPKVDELARAGLQEPDESKRDNIFKQAWQISLFDDVGYIRCISRPRWGV